MEGARRPVDLEEGWSDMVEGVAKLKHILDSVDGESFTSEEYIHLYTYGLVPLLVFSAGFSWWFCISGGF